MYIIFTYIYTYIIIRTLCVPFLGKGLPCKTTGNSPAKVALWL